MSGLLRRIKRSRAADAGETPAEEQAAAPESAPTTPEPAPPVAAPVIEKDPDRPAGLDPAAEAVPAPTGRRARLRRRLRYLRRAREVSLRDLGGLVYEVHRSGAGDMAAHAGLIGGKVRRLNDLDAEAGAIETALAAPRAAETVVFQPGVGGTCDFCGELYGSAARFCSNCGSPTGSAVRATPATIAPEGRIVPPMPEPPGDAAKRVGEYTRGAGDEQAADAAGAQAPGAVEPAGDAAATGDARPADPAATDATLPAAAAGAAPAAEEAKGADAAPAAGDAAPADAAAASDDAQSAGGGMNAADAPTAAQPTGGGTNAADAPTAAQPTAGDAPTRVQDAAEPIERAGNGRAEDHDADRGGRFASHEESRS
jgi:hypothetical protein